jgi:hypothetical protein
MAAWILIGFFSLVVFLILAALVLAAVLRRIGHDVSDLLELEPWAATETIGRDGVVGGRPRKQVERELEFRTRPG